MPDATSDVTSDATPGRAPLLEARAISKRFGGVQALHDVTMSVQPGEIFGLVGPNGAGKTTLFNCLCGQLRPDGGSVRFDGEPIDRLPTYRRARLGIGRTFQRIEVFPELSVRDHLFVAARAHRGDGALWKDLLNLSQPKPDEIATVERVLDMVGLQDVADTPVAALSLGHCRLVELGRALAGEPRMLMADEPSSGLDVQETKALADTLRHVRQEHGTAVLLVEHDLDMVAQVVDQVIVLDFGQQIAAGTLDQVLADPAVRKAYLGKTA
ncbi:MAG TPA: ABC transporter ATP-binding protein [Acidimicrobiales bacterium]|nr:ABC transporter ATP-binding protein [Acidimicrobiales bacterium]